MSKGEEPSNIIPFKYYSEIDKKKYDGIFRVKRISVFGINEIQVTGNELTRGLGTSTPSHALIVQRMATIDHVVDEVIEGAEWFHKGDASKTWSKCHDTTVAELLYKEVIKFDDWFRQGDTSIPNQKEDEEISTGKPEINADSTNSVGRKKSKPKQKESGISEVVVG